MTLADYDYCQQHTCQSREPVTSLMACIGASTLSGELQIHFTVCLAQPPPDWSAALYRLPHMYIPKHTRATKPLSTSNNKQGRGYENRHQPIPATTMPVDKKPRFCKPCRVWRCYGDMPACPRCIEKKEASPGLSMWDCVETEEVGGGCERVRVGDGI